MDNDAISPRKFMSQFFAARTVQIKKEVIANQVFRRRYFSGKCLWDSRPKAIEISESERIVSLAENSGIVIVITERGEYMPRLRYTLQPRTKSWLIQKIEPACANCNGFEGRSACEICSGSGWLPLPDGNLP